MAHERGLYLDSRNLVAGTHNQVVSASLIPEITIFINAIEIARDVPSLLYILALEFRSTEIAADRGAAHGQPSGDIGGKRLSGIIHDPGFISRYRLSGCATADFVSGSGA